MWIRINKITLIIFFILTSFSNTLAQEEYSLNDLYRIALERAERIKISEEDLYISERGRDKALSLLLPRLSVYGNYTRYSEDRLSSTGLVIQPETSESWGIRLDQSITLNGREFIGYRISEENVKKGLYDLYSVREDYLFTVSLAYYDVLRAKKSLEIARANVERLKKHRDAADIRLKVGEVTKTALLRAEAELAGAESELIRAENNLTLARAVLARIVGLDGRFELKEDSSSEGLNTECQVSDLECFKRIAISERADLKGLETQKRIAEDQVRYARGGYWPTLSIEGVYSRREEDPASSFLNKESIYGGLKLNFPFFEGGLRRAEIKEASARQRQSILLYEDRKKAIGVEVENAFLDLITQRGITGKFESQVAFAEDNYRAVSRQFEYGLASSIDVIDANTLLVTAERQLTDARYNYQLAILRLKRATGTLLKTVISQESGVKK